MLVITKMLYLNKNEKIDIETQKEKLSFIDLFSKYSGFRLDLKISNHHILIHFDAAVLKLLINITLMFQ